MMKDKIQNHKNQKANLKVLQISMMMKNGKILKKPIKKQKKKAKKQKT